MKVIVCFIKKEFLQLKKDKRMLAISVIAPVLQLILLAYAANIDVKDIPVVITDFDKTKTSRSYIEKVICSGYFKKIVTLENLEEVDKYLHNGKANIAIIIPLNFERNILKKKKIELVSLIDGSDSNVGSIGANYLSIITTNFSKDILINKLYINKININRIEPALRIWYNPELKSKNFLVPGVLGMLLMLITIVLTSLAIVKEKEIGTLEQLIVTPIKPYQFIIGKLIPFTLIGMIDIVFVIFVATIIFNIPVKGSIFTLYLLSFLFLLSTLGLGLFVSTVASTQQQAMLISVFFIMMPMLYLSGFIFPIENMPKIIQILTYLMPLRYYLTVVRGIFLKGTGLSELYDEAGMLILIGSIILTLAINRFKKRIG